MSKKRFLISAFLISLVGQITFLGLDEYKAFAVDNKYSNQLLNLNVEKSKDSDDVNVTVFTSKPYKVKLTPIKRDNNEYVIFLPETYHSLTSKPDASACNDAVQDVDVKLVPYIGSQANNGYTKITIKTLKDSLKLNVKNEISRQNTEIEDEITKLVLKKENVSSDLPAKQVEKPVSNVQKAHFNSISKSKTSKSSFFIKNKRIKRDLISKEVKYQERTPVKEKEPEQKLALAEPITNETISFKTIVNEESPSVEHNMESNPINNNNLETPPIINTENKLPKDSPVKNLIFTLFGTVFVAILGGAALISKFTRKKKIISVQPIQEEIEETTEESKDYSQSYEEYLKEPDDFSKTVPEQSDNKNLFKEPEIIEGVELSDEKGLYLIQAEGKKALIGIVKSDIFVLNTFSNVTNPTFNIKKTSSTKDRDVFLVQIDSWQGLISCEQDKIKLY
ncbi:MAG: hypothetical protein V2B14_05640 [bacterium]